MAKIDAGLAAAMMNQEGPESETGDQEKQELQMLEMILQFVKKTDATLTALVQTEQKEAPDQQNIPPDQQNVSGQQ